jgi:hypothetical protein
LITIDEVTDEKCPNASIGSSFHEEMMSRLMSFYSSANIANGRDRYKKSVK